MGSAAADPRLALLLLPLLLLLVLSELEWQGVCSVCVVA
jgi:hypothetical protein